MQTLDVAIFIHAAENIYNLCFSWNHKKTLAEAPRVKSLNIIPQTRRPIGSVRKTQSSNEGVQRAWILKLW